MPNIFGGNVFDPNIFDAPDEGPFSGATFDGETFDTPAEAFSANAFDLDAFEVPTGEAFKPEGFQNDSFQIDEEGAVVTLAAAVAGSSAVTASVSKAIELAAAVAGTSTVTANAVLTVSLAGTAAGSSSVTGIIAVQLAGSAAGASAVTGSLSVTYGLATASAGSSAVTADVTRTLVLATASAGSSSVAAALTAEALLAGVSAGSSTVTANISRDVGLAVLVTGATVFATGTLQKNVSFEALATGSSTVTGSINRDVGLAAAAAGLTVISGDTTITGTHLLVGNVIQGRSIVTGIMSGGQHVLPWVIAGTYPESSAVVVTPASAGTFSVEVDDASTFTQGQTIYIDGVPYVIESIAGDTLTLASALLTDIQAGDIVAGELVTAINAGNFAVANSTRYDLEAATVREPTLVEMQHRYPAYVRSQVQERQISLNVYFLANTYAQRRIDYESFESALDSLTGLVSLRWTDENGFTREYLVTALSVSPDAWFHRASAVLIASEPEARAVA